MNRLYIAVPFVLGSVVLVLGIFAGQSDLSAELPGHMINKTDFVVAGAYGPCAMGSTKCQGNRSVSVVCITMSGGVCADQSVEATCGSCEGSEHVVCKATDVEISCTEYTTTCCATNKECHTKEPDWLSAGGCACIDGGSALIGVKIVCN
ncbi:MAG: hypothetical protein LBE12_15660 [Planctomycetaceae bacterium]|jgi:hypothetical protein|nr:hypothetical protein [Planctomycetaceae bacterium]